MQAASCTAGLHTAEQLLRLADETGWADKATGRQPHLIHLAADTVSDRHIDGRLLAYLGWQELTYDMHDATAGTHAAGWAELLAWISSGQMARHACMCQVAHAGLIL